MRSWLGTAADDRRTQLGDSQGLCWETGNGINSNTFCHWGEKKVARRYVDDVSLLIRNTSRACKRMEGGGSGKGRDKD